MSIPLVQNNEKDSINTSIIAIKKNLERINSILGLVDSGSDIDTSEFVKKSDIVDVVQSGNMNPVTSNAVATSNAMPVDTVTSGDMHSVTSNAVAGALGYKANTLPYFDNADTDRNVLQNRIDAMKTYIPMNMAGIYTIRYEGGHYFAYITNGLGSESPIIEIDLYNNNINLFYRVNSTNEIMFRRTI